MRSVSGISFAPKIYEIMADKRMNQFQQVTDAEYVYVEDMNGSQGKIEWNNIIKTIMYLKTYKNKVV